MISLILTSLEKAAAGRSRRDGLRVDTRKRVVEVGKWSNEHCKRQEHSHTKQEMIKIYIKQNT